MRIDLHLHSTASDGAYTPAEVVLIALSHALNVIALTDHDSVNGISAAQAAAQGTSLEVLSGVELSVEDQQADRHILGYLVDHQHEALNAFFAEMRAARVQRARETVERLAALGVVLDPAEVVSLADGGSVGRPHIARAMLRAGHVSTLAEAFERYIGDSGPAYVPHHRVAPGEAIALIHRAGGVAVLAHPGRYADYRPILDELIPLGLDGIEVYYPDHSPPLIRELLVSARRHDLLVTAGSDFHRREADGSARIGGFQPPDGAALVTALRERSAAYQITG